LSLGTLATYSGGAGWQINGSGEVAGTYEDSNGVYHGFTYSNGVLSTINDPGGNSFTTVTGVNASGELVGSYSPTISSSGKSPQGFTYNNGTFTNFGDPSSSFGTYANAINVTGEVAGYY